MLHEVFNSLYIANGEIYNYKNLKIGLSNHRFKTKSDIRLSNLFRALPSMNKFSSKQMAGHVLSLILSSGGYFANKNDQTNLITLQKVGVKIKA